MRCVYHGSKFATDGQCLEQPNLLPDQDFSAKAARQGVSGDRVGRM